MVYREVGLLIPNRMGQGGTARLLYFPAVLVSRWRHPSSWSNMLDMSTHSLKDLRANLGHAVREVAYSGQEAIITDSGTEIAAIISMDDYERLHEHADVADALYLREKRSVDFETVSMAEMLEMLGVADVSRGVAA